MEKNEIDLKSWINSLETDYRSEVIAAGLIENGQDADRVLIARHKGNRKDVSKDVDRVEKIYEDDGSFDLMEYLLIYANRENIYDSLPEGLFHQPADVRKLRSKDDIIQDIRTHREKEFYARRFFQPFEIVLDKIGIDIQRHEQKFHKIHLYDNLPGIFKERWSILHYLSTRQSLLFLRLIPVISEISRNLSQIALLMTIILNCPVQVREGVKTRERLDKKESVPLGKWKLGISSALGKKVENDQLDLEITIGPIHPEQMRSFDYNEKNDRILKELIYMTTPFDRNTVIKYKLAKGESKFKLSAPSHKAWLGINTTL